MCSNSLRAAVAAGRGFICGNAGGLWRSVLGSLAFCVVPAALCSPLASASASASASDAIVFSAEERARITLHGPWPVPVPPDPGNEFSGLPWAEEAGRLLFHDNGLSGDNAVSCATCHQATNGYSDGRSVAVGNQRHFRNTQTLLNVGLQRWFGWDGGTDSLWAAALRPMLSTIEMDNTVEGIAAYLRQATQHQRTLLRDVNGQSVELSDDAITVKAAKLIAAHVRTLTSGITPFDIFRDALVLDKSVDERAFSASARRGLKLFVGKAACHVCHYGANFSNGEFHDIGRPFFIGTGEVDPGRYRGIQRLRLDPYRLSGAFNGTNNKNQIRKTTSVKLSRADWGRWRTPTLRNLVDTAPYMHDGSIATLREVVDAYADIDPERLHSEGESILKPLDLDEREREDLVAFLNSLSLTDRQ